MGICELSATPAQQLRADEIVISSAFGQMDAVDVTAPSVEFDLASLIGRMAGSQQCKTIYNGIFFFFSLWSPFGAGFFLSVPDVEYSWRSLLMTSERRETWPCRRHGCGRYRKP